MQQSTKNTVYDLIRYIPSVIVPTVLGFIAVALYTRLLSPEEYGLYALIFTTSLFIEIIAFHWLNQSTLRYYERFKGDELKEFYSTSFFAFLLVAFMTTAALVLILSLLCHLFDPRKQQLLYYLPLVVLSQSGAKFMLVILRAKRDSLRYTIQISLNSIIKLICGLIFIYVLGRSAEAILLGISIAGIYVFLFESLRLVKLWYLKFQFFRKTIFKKYARYGFPLVGLAFANLILAVSDRYVIELIKDSSHVGIYAAGYKIAETGVLGIILFLSLASFPALITTYENKGELKAKALMQDLLSIFIILLVPAVAGITILSEDIIKVMLGEAYREAYLILPWIAAGIFFLGLCPYYSKSFELKEKTIALPLLYAGPALLNILLNVLLIPLIGIQGAAISTFTAYFGCLVALRITGSKYIKWRFPWKTCLKAVFASLIMCVVVYFLPGQKINWLSLIYKITIGCCVYVTLMMIFEKRIFISGYELFKTKTVSNK